jgi:hypothetical protein
MCISDASAHVMAGQPEVKTSKCDQHKGTRLTRLEVHFVSLVRLERLFRTRPARAVGTRNGRLSLLKLLRR